QAEDGIRDFHVTGVQTCALPIWASQRQGRGAEAAAPTARAGPASAGSPPRGDVTTGSVTDPVAVSSMYTPARSGTKPASKLAPRSEERRGGKQCRSSGHREHTSR